jgi:hypothetical protein
LLEISIRGGSNVPPLSFEASPKKLQNITGQQSRLPQYLIIKSIIELVFVGTLAVGFYLTAFTPFFRGSLDVANARTVAGWAVYHADTQASVEVQLYIDGKFVADGTADAPRPDVRLAGRAEDDKHGFIFETPSLSPGEHEARVFVVHQSGGGKRRTLQLLDKPLVFSVTADNQPAAQQQTEQP